MPAIMRMKYEVVYTLSDSTELKRTLTSPDLNGVDFPRAAVKARVRPYWSMERNGWERWWYHGHAILWFIGRLVNQDEIREQFADGPGRREMLAVCRNGDEGLLIVMDDDMYEPFTIGDRVVTRSEKRRDENGDQYQQPQPAGSQRHSP
jgi:hypothetical protein